MLNYLRKKLYAKLTLARQGWQTKNNKNLNLKKKLPKLQIRAPIWAYRNVSESS